MARHEHFNLRYLSDLRAKCAELGLDIPTVDDVSILGTPLQIGSLNLPNRLTVHPMEGFDADRNGTPGELSYRRYRRYAEGGAALIWFEATSVVSEGRSNPGQFWLHDGNVDVFRRLVQATRDAARKARGAEPLLILQMTHSGRYSKPTGVPAPITAHRNPILDPIHKLGPDHRLVTDEYLDALQDKFLHAAELATAAGFDGVDVKSCHRYLVAELHASFTREGRYGGSLENRTRLLRESLAKIAAKLPKLLITTRLNVYDALSYPYGFGVDKADFRKLDLTEPLQLIAWLQEIGVRLLNVSLGNPYFNPHYNRPYDFPICNCPVPEEHPLEGVARLIHAVRTIQTANPDLAVIGSGYAWLRQFMPNVAGAVLQRHWATLIGQGRSSFAYPDSVKDILATGRMDPVKCCVTCSACTQIMRDGGQTGCVVRDSDIYGPKYRMARRFSLDRLMAEARRCRDCQEPTCTHGCPARIDIPAFIKAFGDGNIPRAYTILKQNNVLPEMCGAVCPASEQCQGHCLENVFCENPIAIQDIQLVVAKTARLQGITGVTLPATPSGKNIAVVGGGPAGLACAIRLLETGHTVTLYEKGDRLGGTPDTAIPEDRYGSAAEEIEAIIKPARDAGRLTLKLGAALGRDVHLADLRRAHDAVFLALGLSDSAGLGEAKGAMGAVPFLNAAKAAQPLAVSKRVAVLGAGNTAMDAGTTALRLGARDVFLLYRRSFKEMPAWIKERDAFLAAGGHILLLTQPLSYLTDANGQLTGIRIARTELGEPDESGRRRPVLVPDTESVLAVEMAIEALGQGIAPALRDSIKEIRFTREGRVRAEPETGATSVAGVFAGGDIVNGGTTAVQGIAEGMRAGAAIDAYLRG
ncbi:MAG: hypothetical protein A3K19_02065 [Lentisphaerae bacterium RIFOXYB12_FULL_65_16]|nr:MAG: hypothetical protein A3K18_25285 [Lentisphaerae bacterium RIFOXYA12_64_32]OGV92585.1 MAG: hypothetical protein A3K19_02065 [Lentisphaerae bacterium RIFOXYB12_FULL_65_16]